MILIGSQSVGVDDELKPSGDPHRSQREAQLAGPIGLQPSTDSYH